MKLPLLLAWHANTSLQHGSESAAPCEMMPLPLACLYSRQSDPTCQPSLPTYPLADGVDPTYQGHPLPPAIDTLRWPWPGDHATVPHPHPSRVLSIPHGPGPSTASTTPPQSRSLHRAHRVKPPWAAYDRASHCQGCPLLVHPPLRRPSGPSPRRRRPAPPSVLSSSPAPPITAATAITDLRFYNTSGVLT